MQEDLRHVHQHHHDHARAGVVVQRPQEPAQRLLVVEVQQALVRLVGRGHVDQRQADAGEDLDQREASATRCRRRTTSPSARRSPRGTGCRIIGSSVSLKPSRGVEPVADRFAASSFMTAFLVAFTPCSVERVLQRRIVRRLDLAAGPSSHAPHAVEQAARRRAGGVLAVRRSRRRRGRGT